jgi:NodT family efflux transporter outer membrane factor (OMF) lipoprotein
MKRPILAAALLLSGCAVGPDYRDPHLPTPSTYEDLPAAKAQAPLSVPVAAQTDLSQWWLQFNDAELQGLITRALQSNLDLLTAESRLREARQQVIVAGAAGLPKVDANGLAAHFHSNSNLLSKLSGSSGGSSGGGAAPSGPTDIKLYSLGFDATWEIDVFGGIRRGVEAADASREAAVWQTRDSEVSLTAEIATDYLTLRATQARIAILQSEAKEQQDVLNLTAARARTGFVTQLDVNQQNALVASTLAQIPELQAQARAMEHAIAVLLAEQPEAMTAELDRSAAAPAMPTTLPVGLPSDLLRRRPDVRVAERQLAAATAQIGVADADLYPKFDLIAAASFTGSHLSNLLSGSNLGEAGLGSIMFPIFHGGQIEANIRSKKEEEKQAYYAYSKSILGAVQDAEDALARYTTEQQRLVELQRAVDASRSSSTIALQQYRAGLVTYVNVLTAQANELSARDQQEQSRQAFAADLVSLYKALGGGWQENLPATKTAAASPPRS